MQSILDSGSKLIKATKDERQFTLQAGFIIDLLSLFFDLLQAFSHPCHPRFKLPFVDQSVGIAVNEPGNALLQASHPCLEAAQLVGCLFFLQQAASIFLFQPLWVLQQSAHFLPDRLLHQIGAQLLIPTEPQPTEAVGIRANAAQELGGNYFDEHDRQQIEKRLIRRLEQLGYHVSLEPVAQAA